MSECILTLDITRDPLEISLVDLGHQRLHLIEHKYLPVGKLFTESLFLPQSTPEPNAPSAPPETVAVDAAGTNAAPSETPLPLQSNALPQSFMDSLRTTLEGLAGRWSSAVVIIPPNDYLSLNIELPFTDTKSINRVLSLEVQDIMPFEVSEFILQSHTLNSFPDKQFDIHISMVPKAYIRGVLSLLNSVGVEPLIVSTPASILQALCHIAPNSFASDAVFLARVGAWYTIGIRIDGVFCQDRIIHLNANGHEKTWGALCHDINLTIQAAEKRYARQIEKVYLLGDFAKTEVLATSLNRQLEAVTLEEYLTSSNGSTSVTALSAIFAREVEAPPILTNFRTGEFAYSPKLKEVLRALKILLPYFTWIFLGTVFSLAVVFLIRENRISRLRSSLYTQINAIIPELALENIADDQLLPTIFAETHRVNQDLLELGSPSKLTPLDALLEISKSFPTVERVKIAKVVIEGNQITLEGSAPDLATIEHIRKTLKKNDQFPKVTQSQNDGRTSLSGPNEKSLKLTIYLKE